MILFKLSLLAKLYVTKAKTTVAHATAKTVTIAIADNHTGNNTIIEANTSPLFILSSIWCFFIANSLLEDIATMAMLPTCSKHKLA